MKFSSERELEILHQLATHPDEHLVLEVGDYGPGGSGPIVHRDGTSQLLHRYLFNHALSQEEIKAAFQRGGVIGWFGGVFLLPDCDEPLCRNPRHRLASASPRRPVRHAGQTRAPGGPNAADRNRAKTHCVNNHEFTPENTYTWTDARGREHRKCRRCTLKRTRAQHTANRTERSTTP